MSTTPLDADREIRAPDPSGGRSTRGGRRAGSLLRPLLLPLSLPLVLSVWVGCAPIAQRAATPVATEPLTVTRAIGRYDSARDASLRLVATGLEADAAGRPGPALASYQRAIRVDPTNPFAYLALARHHLEADTVDEAEAFLDQARSLFEAEEGLGPAVDVWGLGLRAGIVRARGREERAAELYEAARALGPSIWRDERLSAAELR